MNKADILETLKASQMARTSRVFLETTKMSSGEETDNFSQNLLDSAGRAANFFFEIWPISELLTKPLEDNIYIFSNN